MGIWDTAVGETLVCEPEGKNIHNPYTVTAVKGGNIVGHVLHAISSVCFCFFGEKIAKLCALLLGNENAWLIFIQAMRKACPLIIINTIKKANFGSA